MDVKKWCQEKNLQKFLDKSFYTKKRIIIIIAAVLVVALLLFFIFGGKGNGEVEAQTYTETAAERMDITETIEQSGVVEPYERYEITSLVKGEIIESPFEEGDLVQEGDTLYRIDDEDAQLTIEKTQNSIERAQMTLDETNKDISKLNIYATASGKLTNFDLNIGDTVSGGPVATIINTDVLTVDIPFAVQDFDVISVGDSVTITSALYMTTLPGKVIHKYDATAGNGGDGSVLKNIEVEISNPGALAAGTTFAATVHTSFGDVNSAGSGTVGGGTETTIKADVSGTVVSLPVKEGDYVKKGQLIASLKSDNLTNSRKSNELSLKDSKLSLKSNQKTLENYNITSPISGTVITKNSKAGDKIDNSNSSTVMMVVADMSKMKFTISVDELDISKIALGQKAIVDADALPDETFEAEITTISSEGTSSGDGVTTFTVELTINEPGGLKSGMNVNANILINEAKDAIAIPEDALMSVNGTTARVLVKTTGKESNNKAKEQKNESAEGDKMPDMPQNGERPEMPSDGEMPERPEGGEMPERAGGGGNAGGADGVGMRNIPEDCEMREIEVGISNGSYIEVISGLSEGEVVVYIPSTAGSADPFSMMMRGMGGGMPGGGMPGGGGGMPGGGNRAGGGAPR